VVDHFIDHASHHWIMDFCLCREGNGCEQFPQGSGCLFMGEAVLKINPNMGRLVSREAAHQHVQRCREAGLVHMIGRNKLDMLWLGAGPGEKLLTVCNCCPCCCLWKVLPDITPQISAKVQRMPGVRVVVSDKCLGCGDCTQGICFVDAIRLVNGQSVIGAECRGCGQCVEICPNEAIELSIDQYAYVDEVIERISQLVDVH
jgi:ferredoxin